MLYIQVHVLNVHLPFIMFYRGLLTGKFKRDSKPDESGSRIGFATSQEKLVNQAMPSLNAYTNDDKFWNLMSVMEKIANNQGNSTDEKIFSFIYLFCSRCVCVCGGGGGVRPGPT